MSARIFESIQQDTVRLRSLTELFQAQANALRKRDIESLPVLNDRILALTGTLQESSRLRALWLTELGFSDSREGMRLFLSAHATPANMAEWQDFCDQARASQQANQLSARLLTMQQQLTGNMLNQLGRTMETGYDRRGAERYHGSSITLGYA